MRVVKVIFYVAVLGIISGCTSVRHPCGEDIYDPYSAEAKSVPLRWPANSQNHMGSWGKTPTWFVGEGHPGYTSLVLLTFLKKGETPLSERYGKTVQDAMKWLYDYGIRKDLLASIRKHPDTAAAHSHALATLAICESYGMTKIPFLKSAMEVCLGTMIDSQLQCGGFAPGLSPDGRWNTRLSAWCTYAMISAKLAGSENPALGAALAKAQHFFTDVCRLSDGNYSPSQDAKDKTHEWTTVMANAILLRLNAGNRSRRREFRSKIYDSHLPILEASATGESSWKTESIPMLEALFFATEAALFHHSYYKRSRTWSNAVEKALVNRMSADGSWTMATEDGYEPNDGAGRLLASTLCALIITPPPRYLPTFEPVEDVEGGERGGMVIEIE